MRRALLAFAIVVVAHTAPAQDGVQLDPKHFTLVYEDARIRVVRTILPAGESLPTHSHPERVVVVVRPATLQIVDAGGKSNRVEVKAGEATPNLPQTHTVTNLGKTDFEEVSTEFKTPVGKQPPSAEAPTKPNTEGTTPHLPSPEPAVPKKPAPAPAGTSESAPMKAPEPRPSSSVASQIEERVEPISPIKGAKVVTINGQKLSYLDVGQGEPLIFVHDVGTDLRNWAQQIDEFAKSYRVIAYSRRYHYPNASTGREDDYTFKQNTADLLALIDELKLGKVHAIGHAYGGAVVAQAAIQKPEAFRSIVVMEPPLDSLLPQIQADGSRYARNQILSIARREVLKRRNPESAMRSYVEWSHSSGSWDALSPDAKQRYVENANALAAYAAHPEPAEFVCDDGKKLHTPMLVVQGEASAPNYRIVSSTLAECVPGAKRTAVPHATHWMHRENAPAFNSIVMDFLASAK